MNRTTPIRLLAALLTSILAIQTAIAQEDSKEKPAKITKEAIGDTPNTTTLGGKVFFGGQPPEADMKAYSDKGVKVVINLRMDGELENLGFDEAKTVEALGMKYVHVPMGREVPKTSDLERIFSALDGAGDAPVLLHCASSNRVGMIWSIYRAKRNGMSLEDAIADGRAAGMKSEALEAAARGYLAEWFGDI